MTDRELDTLEEHARRPNHGAKYYPPDVVLRLIEALREARRELAVKQGDLFATEVSK